MTEKQKAAREELHLPTTGVSTAETPGIGGAPGPNPVFSKTETEAYEPPTVSTLEYCQANEFSAMATKAVGHIADAEHEDGTITDIRSAINSLQQLAKFRYGKLLTLLIATLSLLALPSCISLTGGSLSYDATQKRWNGTATVSSDAIKINPDGSFSFGNANPKPLGTK